MSRNVYTDILLHVTWHTKESRNLILERFEDRLYRYLKHRVCQTSGAFCHEVNGTENHVHAAVGIPPNVNISEWIGQLKGASSHHINHAVCRRRVLEWQDGYGAVSFGRKDLESVCDYIRKQKEHHAQGRLVQWLEWQPDQR
ncbi:MAG TPA: IS200/IS605 family transposase [Acidobacteriota bacterium]|jgi:REP element-mobilizing transposase RayT|nr:IS200/IS605 family transposase [Acidobacteriota bacterium]